MKYTDFHKNIINILCMLIASVILLGLCSVFGGKDTPSVRLQAGSEISVNVGTAAMYMEAQNSAAIFKDNVYEGLLYIPDPDDAGIVKDCLSESHTVSDDGLT